ncbi:M42 family metallopeptidase [Peribacillus deserti]|uniref:Peptidase M42 n=1 Tax=Peribacillus deserti TaxID=673318 RepID=A0A2N5M4X1_9BACI|nr:M42 family metallopeptidase [Peribacillus deserti]PLT29416.1 peptidase M42 [Peribacillus deserti]
MSKDISQYLVELDRIPGVSGAEELVAEYVQTELEGYYDEKHADSLGNQFFIKKGKNPDLKIMLSAHMDEIGFIVQYIDNHGFVYFAPAGMHDPRMVINQVLNIHTEKGQVKGITGGKPAHIVTAEEAAKAIPISELFIDLGTVSREETEELGVQIGDYITFDREGQFLNNGKVFTGKAVDDRSGVAVLMEVMKQLKNKEIEATVYGVASVQEEVGIRGAGPAAYHVKPNVALAIDVTLAGGTPGLEDKQIPIGLGKGPAIKFFDWAPHSAMIGNSVPRWLTQKLVNVAKENSIPFQREVLLNGATDGWAISLSGEGVATGCISLPSRYIHSATGCVHVDNLENAAALIVKFIESTKE